MKQNIRKNLLVAGLAMLTVPAAFGQNKKSDPKDKTENKSVQTIVITRDGNLDEKTVVEIKGDKVMVNGKDAKEDKDIKVHVNTFKTPSMYHMNGGGNTFSFNGDGFSLFTEDENRAMLGVTTEGNDDGAEIASVIKESAAEKAGLQKGDIITKIDDRKIESTDDVTEAIRAHKPGEKANITYFRDGKEHKTTAELTKWKGVRMNAVTVPGLQGLAEMGDLQERWKEAMPGAPFAYAIGRPKLGLSIQDIDDNSGAKVLDVDEDSPAAKAGIKKDDIIISVDDIKVTGTNDVVRATRISRDKTDFSFKVKRGNSVQTIEVKFPRKLKTADL